MDEGRANIALSIGLIFLLLIRIPNSCYRLLGETADPDKLSHEKMLLNVNWDNTGDHCLAPMPFYRRHLGLVFNTRWGFHHRRTGRYPNSDSTFQLIRLAISRNIQLNPGPSTLESPTKKPFCQICSRTIARNHRMFTRKLCDLKYHIKCGNVTPKQYKEIIYDPKSWSCEECTTQQLQRSGLDLDSNLSLLYQLLFASLTDELFTAAICCEESRSSSLSSNGEKENESYLSDLV